MRILAAATSAFTGCAGVNSYSLPKGAAPITAALAHRLHVLRVQRPAEDARSLDGLPGLAQTMIHRL
jgi:hypothetical protein